MPWSDCLHVYVCVCACYIYTYMFVREYICVLCIVYTYIYIAFTYPYYIFGLVFITLRGNSVETKREFSGDNPTVRSFLLFQRSESGSQHPYLSAHNCRQLCPCHFWENLTPSLDLFGHRHIRGTY